MLKDMIDRVDGGAHNGIALGGLRSVISGHSPRSWLARGVAGIGTVLVRGWHDRRGHAVVMFGLSSFVVLNALGAGIDLSRTFLVRQQLAAVANVTCQFANSSSIVSLMSGAGGGISYVSNVTSFVNSALAGLNTGWTQTTANPFSYTAGSAAGTVNLTASVPTTMMRGVGITTIPVSATQPCPITLSTNQPPAIGSPLMANPPAIDVTIPVPTPRVGTSLIGSGSSVAAQP